MSILIIGSRGFIGKRLTGALRQAGQEVWEADVVVDYTSPNYFQISADNSNFLEVFKKTPFEVCINCSGAASVPDSMVNPLRDYMLNVYNVALLLNAIHREQPGCRFVQLSSAAVYGNPATLPVAEDAFAAPKSPYGLHKKQAEELCRMYHEYYGICCTVVRIFSAYGEGLTKQILWDLHKKSVTLKEISLFGTGRETRDFIHVDDLARAIELILTRSKGGFEIFNIGNGQQVTIERLATLYLATAGYKGRLQFTGETREGDPLNWEADISRLQGLGYAPAVSLEEGIKRYHSWVCEAAH